jgi:hypothetical protein
MKTINEVGEPVVTDTTPDDSHSTHDSDGTMGLVAGTSMGAIAGGIVGAVLAGPGGALLGVAAGGALGAAGGEAAAHIGNELEEGFHGDGILETHATGDDALAGIGTMSGAIGPVAPGEFTGLPMAADIYGVSGGIPPGDWTESHSAIADVSSDAEIARQARDEVVDIPTPHERDENDPGVR